MDTPWYSSPFSLLVCLCGQGRKVSFKNTIIIMTSNLGSGFILEMGQASSEAVKDMVMNTVRAPHAASAIPYIQGVRKFKKIN